METLVILSELKNCFGFVFKSKRENVIHGKYFNYFVQILELLQKGGSLNIFDLN